MILSAILIKYQLEDTFYEYDLIVRKNSMHTNQKHHRSILQSIARRAMLERGLLPDFSAEAFTELEQLQAPSVTDKDVDGIHDMLNLLWSSIDNNDSRDLDQLTVAESMPNGKIQVM